MKIISHNVQGFYLSQKRKMTFLHYKSLGTDIFLLQEIHFSNSNHPHYFDKAFKQFYCTTHTAKSRGVAIFIRNSLVFDILHVYKDPDSYLIILQGTIQGCATTMASVYAPNEAQASFFQHFFDTLDWYLSPHVIVGGDFNLTAHPALDRSRVTPSSKDFLKSVIRSLNSLQLIDTWQALNVSSRSYTFYSNPYASYACLDYIFCTPTVLANSSAAEIHVCPWSERP